MNFKNFKKLLIFTSSFAIFCLIFFNGHINYSKATYGKCNLVYNQNIAEAASWTLVKSFGVGVYSDHHTYSQYLDSDYDYRFTVTGKDQSVGARPKLTVFDIASPYVIFYTAYYGGYNNDSDIMQPSTSGNYEIDTYRETVDLYRSPRVNPFVQYGKILTPIDGYTNSAIFTQHIVIDKGRGDSEDIWGDVTSGVKDISFGTIKYDDVSRKFTAILSNFTGVMGLNGTHVYPYSFYIVDRFGTKTQIFRQEIPINTNALLGGSRQISISDVNSPVKIQVILESPTPVTTNIPFGDTQAPSDPILLSSSIGYTNKDVTISASSSDAQSGVMGFQFSNDNLNWGSITSGTYTDTLEGARLLYCRSVDNAWNISNSSSIWMYKDSTNPVILNSSVQNISNKGYDLYLYEIYDPLNITNNSKGSGINRVQIPTWTENKGQDDIQLNWQTNRKASAIDLGNGTWYYRVNISDHSNEIGPYDSEIYVWDNAGNFTSIRPNIYPVYLILPPILKIILPVNNVTYFN